ncbi:MAG TPA: YceI family protein [Actinomycetes bacterium]|nr:YceI family protein [Actinomycetes bacterium]
MSTTTTRTHNGVEIPAAGTFVIDKSHAIVGFVARHLMVAKVRGRFTELEGTITIAEDPAESSAQVVLQTASVTTNDEGRDAHVKSADFLDVETYPTISFASTSLQERGDGRYVLAGDLTIKDVTKPVELDVEFEGRIVDPWGGERIGFTASTEVEREDWGLTWNVALESGGVLVSKKIKLEVEVEAVRQA